MATRAPISGTRNSVNRDVRKAFQIEGLPEMQAKIAKLITATTGRDLKEIMLTGAKEVHDCILTEIDARVSKQHTGHLQEAVFYAHGDESKPDALVGINHKIAPHAHLVEYGSVERHTKNGKSTGVMPAIPIIRPAATKAGPKVVLIVKTGFVKLIETATK